MSSVHHLKKINLMVIFIILIIQFIFSPMIHGYENSLLSREWTDTEIVSSESTGSNQWPSIDIDSTGTIHVAWMDNSPYGGSGGDSDIFYKYKTPDGFWSQTEVISSESISFSAKPCLRVDTNDVIHVAWYDYSNYDGSGSDGDIFYKYKQPGGSWNVTEVVSTESSSTSLKPCLDIDSYGTVHIAWEDSSYLSGSGSDFDIFYKNKPQGESWSTTELVSTESYDYSIHASLCVDVNNIVHVAWHDYSNYDGSGTDNDIFYKYRSTNGLWTTTEVVSADSQSYSLYPILDDDPDGGIHIAWKEKIFNGYPDDWDVLYKYKASDGSWSDTEVVTYESNTRSDNHTLTVDDQGTVHIIWDEITTYGGSGADNDIFYKYKNDEGIWTEAELVSTESSIHSRWPSAIVDPYGSVHIVWGDRSLYGSTPSYICYKSKTIETPVAEFIFNPINPNQNEEVQFTDQSYDNNGYITSWYWDFGDGNFSSFQHPTHSYEHSNIYEVSLTITNNNGQVDTETKTIMVNLLEVNDINQSLFDHGFPIRITSYGNWGGAQNFTPTINMLTNIQLLLRRFGTPEFNLTVEIHQSSLNGPILHSEIFHPEDIIDSWEWYTIDMNNLSLIENESYFIVCMPAPEYVTNSNGYEWGYAFGNQYDGGAFWFTRDGGNLWRDLPMMYEFSFQINGYHF